MEPIPSDTQPKNKGLFSLQIMRAVRKDELRQTLCIHTPVTMTTVLINLV